MRDELAYVPVFHGFAPFCYLILRVNVGVWGIMVYIKNTNKKSGALCDYDGLFVFEGMMY
jgi:hypothetical protein